MTSPGRADAPPNEFTREAIVVLGAAVWPGGVASPALRRRVLHGIGLLRAGRAPVLVMTGGVGRHPPAEAQVMADLARRAGVRPPQVLTEPRASSTYESGRFCSALLAERGWSRIFLVSDGYHLRRAVRIFRDFGVEAEGSAPADDGPRLAPRIRELVAFVWYRGTRRLRGARRAPPEGR